MLIEQLSFADALYTTIDMMATVGNVVHPLSEAGRMFTVVVIVLGVGSLLYTFGAGMEFVIEGHFSAAVRRHFVQNKIAALRKHYIVGGFGRVGSQRRLQQRISLSSSSMRRKIMCSTASRGRI
jgi:voltage-gated potassium channel